ncbi:UDP-glucose 4-epimerase GalE [Liquorilactobacillus mali]|uniref:UDP-glucose 4-epimerase n=1 Tax=Liquorilactobacillus mali KCTC 3596 = DSM 20444 TaxID=1046596 RepID=A0A0R2ED37_9LACO|nr:UDP-glucose 4-epimerase GalE [Liquorilactobacillus mali]KRN10396.1 UDP-galactose 4-epimerase [Liquorilactobacillus mali KCTC 3596 = DSM 20444]MDC7952687.1 UDP-glucose 4-epimerase GalE [Liquorilactobacillus mali]MDV7758083.1 UDP-glucose 4-epimerase GalE [Liquorilactobacillus mali]QFQ74626.1 UDP-glucose 4-epimerase GalE [Liquorilactobacillus mali]
MSLLVLGGAGYIGSHMVKRLLDEKEDVVVIDNLSKGHMKAVDARAVFIEGDIRNKSLLRNVFEKYEIEAVFHFCAYMQIPESLAKPNDYFDNNVYGLIALIDVMKDHKISKLIFSSSAAVYGIPESSPISEETNKNPINPYGLTKLMMEQMMKWDGEAYGINWLAFRYFNVAGAQIDCSIGEDHRPESHLIPIILEAASGKRDYVAMCGNDYATRDGYNIRDYVHVVDLVDAHYLGLKYLRNGGKSDVFNIGSKHGYSVKEIVHAVKEQTGINFKVIDAPRRGGDPDELVANSEKIRRILGWNPRYSDINTMIQSAWNWAKSHPNGFEE